MNADDLDDLMTVLSQRQVELTPAAGGRLLVRGPAGSLTPELWKALEAAKPQLLVRLCGTASAAGRSPEHDTNITTKPPAGGCGDIGDASRGMPAIRYLLRVDRAGSWRDLESILSDAQVEFVNGALAGVDVERVAACCRLRAREVPEHAC